MEDQVTAATQETTALAEKIMTWIAENGVEFGLKILAAVAIFIIGKMAAKGVRKLIGKALEKNKIDETLLAFVCNLAYAGLMTFVIVAALGAVGIKTASFVAVLGAAGLAVGLALQGSLSNFAAGVLMLVFKPFKVGQFVDAGGAAGIVEEIDIFTTKMRTPDNKAIIIPNSKIMGDNIINFAAKDTRRVDLVIGVSYGDDLQKVKKVIQDVLNADDRILKDPAPTIGLLELGDSSVNFAVRPWTATSSYWDVYFSTMETIKERFDKEGISIPFPQSDVHLFEKSA